MHACRAATYLSYLSLHVFLGKAFRTIDDTELLTFKHFGDLCTEHTVRAVCFSYEKRGYNRGKLQLQPLSEERHTTKTILIHIKSSGHLTHYISIYTHTHTLTSCTSETSVCLNWAATPLGLSTRDETVFLLLAAGIASDSSMCW